jgi:hypothetical protein
VSSKCPRGEGKYVEAKEEKKKRKRKKKRRYGNCSTTESKTKWSSPKAGNILDSQVSVSCVVFDYLFPPPCLNLSRFESNLDIIEYDTCEW